MGEVAALFASLLGPTTAPAAGGAGGGAAAAGGGAGGAAGAAGGAGGAAASAGGVGSTAGGIGAATTGPAAIQAGGQALVTGATGAPGAGGAAGSTAGAAGAGGAAGGIAGQAATEVINAAAQAGPTITAGPTLSQRIGDALISGLLSAGDAALPAAAIGVGTAAVNGAFAPEVDEPDLTGAPSGSALAARDRERRRAGAGARGNIFSQRLGRALSARTASTSAGSRAAATLGGAA